MVFCLPLRMIDLLVIVISTVTFATSLNADMSIFDEAPSHGASEHTQRKTTLGLEIFEESVPGKVQYNSDTALDSVLSERTSAYKDKRQEEKQEAAKKLKELERETARIERERRDAEDQEMRETEARRQAEEDRERKAERDMAKAWSSKTTSQVTPLQLQASPYATIPTITSSGGTTTHWQRPSSAASSTSSPPKQAIGPCSGPPPYPEVCGGYEDSPNATVKWQEGEKYGDYKARYDAADKAWREKYQIGSTGSSNSSEPSRAMQK